MVNFGCLAVNRKRVRGFSIRGQAISDTALEVPKIQADTRFRPGRVAQKLFYGIWVGNFFGKVLFPFVSNIQFSVGIVAQIAVRSRDSRLLGECRTCEQ